MSFFPYEIDRHNSSLWLSSAILLSIVLYFIHLFLTLHLAIISLLRVLFRKGALFAPIQRLSKSMSVEGLEHYHVIIFKCFPDLVINFPRLILQNK